MLMIQETPPGELPRPAKRLLEGLQAAEGQWLSRSELAKAIGRDKGLNPYDVQLLADLEHRGLVEARKRPREGFIPYEWEYRAKPE
jgi:hypothetical protein